MIMMINKLLKKLYNKFNYIHEYENSILMNLCDQKYPKH